MCGFYVLKKAFRVYKMSQVAPVALEFYLIDNLKYCECIGC